MPGAELDHEEGNTDVWDSVPQGASSQLLWQPSRYYTYFSGQCFFASRDVFLCLALKPRFSGPPPWTLFLLYRTVRGLKVHSFNCWTYLLFFFLILWLCHVACGILVPWPGIEPRPSAVKAQSPNHWTTREFLISPSNPDCLSEHQPNVASCLLDILSDFPGSQLNSSSPPYHVAPPEFPLLLTMAS